ncbi:MAG: rhodanese-like domain-containing protein [Pirellulaceae bacterium]
MKTITPKQLEAVLEQGESVELIDVRTPVEFREVHITFARNMPLDALDPRELIDNRHGDADRPLYVVCRSGNRSSKACEMFEACGFHNVYSVEGGTAAWDEAGLPVRRGKKAVSLERQVRIAAGFLVFTGVVLGYFLHPAFLILSGFVGAGLMFAGVTDTCGMGMLIARMPWNQVRCETPTEADSPASESEQASVQTPRRVGTGCCS